MARAIAPSNTFSRQMGVLREEKAALMLTLGRFRSDDAPTLEAPSPTAASRPLISSVALCDLSVCP